MTTFDWSMITIGIGGEAQMIYRFIFFSLSLEWGQRGWDLREENNSDRIFNMMMDINQMEPLKML